MYGLCSVRYSLAATLSVTLRRTEEVVPVAGTPAVLEPEHGGGERSVR